LPIFVELTPTGHHHQSENSTYNDTSNERN
jgi:hypothetical protein